MNASRRPSSAALLADAAQWRLLALLLSRPTPDRRIEVAQLAAEIDAPRLVAAARAWCDHATEGAYLHLLGPGGLVPAREVAYRAFADPGWLLADIVRYHRAFGFPLAAEEPSDHIAALAEFVSYLLVKEVYARECEDHEAVEVTRNARERFVGEHLAPIAAPMAERLDACGATEWSAAAHLLAAKVPAPPPSATTAELNEEVLQCGGCIAT
jgi:TorA maturation chaperone TorD